jgi:pyruvate,water dikinase
MSKWWNIFGKRPRSETVASLRSKIERFRTLLDRNNLVLELMAEAGESLGGDLLFDFQYLRGLAAQLEDFTERVVLDLNLVTENRYLALAEAFDRVRTRVAEALESRPSVPRTPYVLPLDEIDRDLSGAAGEKMACLSEIRKRLECKVPDGFVITSRACLRIFEEIRLADRLRRMLEEGRALGEGKDAGSLARRIEARLRDLILEAHVPRDLSRSIHKALGRLTRTRKAPGLFAVRSSAVGEDGDLSFAGLHETCLGVPAADVLENYKRVLASLFTSSAVVYRMEREEPLEQALMAVGCIRMVPARSSGVAYTLDPNDPERDVLIVSAAPGLGRMVVEGGGSIDRFVVSRVPPYPVLSREVRQKDQMYGIDPHGGVRPSCVPPDRRDLPAVPDEFLAEVAETALKIERYMKCAQDVEWAQDEDGALVILQARALQLRAEPAAFGRRAQAEAGRHRILLAGRGTIACRGIGYGRAVVVRGDEVPSDLPRDFVLVAHSPSPHLAALVPRAGAVITDVGASTGHLATISREFHVPAIVDAAIATSVLAGGPEITVDAEENVVYEGRVDGLLRYQVLRQSSFEDAREFRILRRMLKRISPLNLKDPQAKNFVPRCCETYHDIIRFAHEKAVEYFLEGHEIGAATKSPNCKAVDLAVPLDLLVIDVGGGLEIGAEDPRCNIEQIRCIPLRALLEGLNAPGVWSTEPAEMDLGSFMSSAMAPSALSAPRDGLSCRNLAVVSDHYVNLNLNLGYHFNQVDSYLSEVRNDNYIYFRFAGGLTDIARRSRRAKMISIILDRQDFVVDTKGDFIVARLKKFEQDTMLQRMRMLGLLIGFTRQMDVRMREDSMIARGVDEFLQILHNSAAQPAQES